MSYVFICQIYVDHKQMPKTTLELYQNELFPKAFFLFAVHIGLM